MPADPIEPIPSGEDAESELAELEWDETNDPVLDEADPPETKKYDLNRHREDVREKIALRLLWLLIGTVAATGITFLVVLGEDATGQKQAMEDLLAFVQVVLPVVTTLLGTVVGFYFGAVSRQRGGADE